MEIEKRQIWENVLSEDYLELSDGRTVKNIVELMGALSVMSEADFRLHVYDKQNDFAEWIMEAYWDEKLAGNLLKIRDRKKMLSFLRKVVADAKKKGGLKIVKPKRKNVLQDIGEMYG